MWSYTSIPLKVFMAGCLNIETNLLLFLPLPLVLWICCYYEVMRKCSVRLKQENGCLKKGSVLGELTGLSCFLVHCCTIGIFHKLYC